MHIPGLAQEYERTCEDCGQTWRVPRWAAYPHMQGLPMSGGGRGGVQQAADAVAAANAERAERAASLRNCPKVRVRSLQAAGDPVLNRQSGNLGISKPSGFHATNQAVIHRIRQPGQPVPTDRS
jgi:hypothetical protein